MDLPLVLRGALPIPIGQSSGLSNLPKNQLAPSLLITAKRRQALFGLANEHKENIVLSEVCGHYNIDSQASSFAKLCI